MRRQRINPLGAQLLDGGTHGVWITGIGVFVDPDQRPSRQDVVVTPLQTHQRMKLHRAPPSRWSTSVPRARDE